MKKLLCSVLFVIAAAAVARPAAAKVTVVTTVQTFRSIVQDVGGDRVSVTAMVGANVDPHFVDPKPSYAVLLNKADLLVLVGLDLEVGWLPPLVEQSRNPRIQTGQTGYLDASTCGIAVRETGAATSRTQGDIHPMGNPHYWLPPDNALKVARCVADRLAVLDGAGAQDYERNYQAFATKLEAYRKQWAVMAKGLAGVQVVTYHKSWTYMTAWLGLTEIGYVEPKPGVPPDPQHLAVLTRDARSKGARLVIMESFYPQNTARRVAELGGMKLVTLPSDAGGDYASYFDVVGRIIAVLSTAAAGKG